jgi:cytochrome c2/uncharacterized membrane protein
MKSKIIAFVAIVLIALTLSIPALAGGWAVITLERLPSDVVAGKPYTVRFAVRQHGKTLMSDLTPAISAQNADNGDAFSIDALPVNGYPGRYEAILTFPSAGTWEWAIQAFSMDQLMPDLVVSASPLVSNALPKQGSRLPLLTGIVGLVIALAALAVSLRSKSRWALSLVLLGLMVAGAGFAFTAGKAEKSNQPVSASQTASEFETGQALFIAKGCLTCHVNNRVESKYYDFRLDVGPNLTSYTASPDFLRMWLQNPASVRPNTEMPDLDLDMAEIDALITFLSANAN